MGIRKLQLGKDRAGQVGKTDGNQSDYGNQRKSLTVHPGFSPLVSNTKDDFGSGAETDMEGILNVMVCPSFAVMTAFTMTGDAGESLNQILRDEIP